MDKVLQEMIDRLVEAEKAYYNATDGGAAKTLMEDEEYDALKDEVYRRLPADHPFLDKIGHTPVSNWPKVEHQMLMGSQNKAKNLDEFMEWAGKFHSPSGVYLVQDKLDGFSIELVYADGKLDIASTRGDGSIGENITENAKMFRGLPHRIPIKGKIRVRAEGHITKADYAKFPQGDYKNARNAASGISRRYDGSQSRYISVRAIDIHTDDFERVRLDVRPDLMSTEYAKTQVLLALGFKIPSSRICPLNEVENIYSYYVYGGGRDKLSYDIDGLVVKINDLAEQQHYGIDHNKPNGQIALKFDPAFGQTKVLHIASQVGRTGVLVPVAHHDSVDILGATHTTTGLHNWGYVVENRIADFSEIIIEKRGDIIPKVTEVVANHGDAVPPAKCPKCGEPTRFDGVNLWCGNRQCEGRRLQSILHWFVTIGMKGFGESTFETLMKYGAGSIRHIYNITPEALHEIMGKKSAQNFIKELDRTMTMTEGTFLAALGVTGLGQSKSEAVIKAFGFENVFDIDPKELAKTYGFADISSESICSGLAEVKDLARELLSVVVVKSYSGNLSGKSFCGTGALKTMSRDGLKQKIVENGGIYKTSVSMGLDFLVTNTPDSGSSKNKKAQKYGTIIITEDQLLELIDGTSEVGDYREK